MPSSRRPQTACSRLEPQPKFGPVIRTAARSHGARLRTKSGRGRPGASKRRSNRKPSPSPRAIDALEELLGHDLVGIEVGLRQRRGHAGEGGERFHGAQTAARQRRRTSVMRAGDRGGGDHRRAHQMGARARALAAFEVAVGAGGAAIARRSGGRRSSPRTSSSPPGAIRSPRRRNTCVEAFGFGLRPHRGGPGTTSARTPGATRRPRSTRAASRRSSRRPLVHEPMKAWLIGTPSSRWPGARPMYSRARVHAAAAGQVRLCRRVGHGPVDGCTLVRARSPGDHGCDRAGIEADLGVEQPRLRRCAGRASRRRPHPTSRPVGTRGRPCRYSNSGVVRRNDGAARRGLDAHVAQGQPPFDAERRDRTRRRTR